MRNDTLDRRRFLRVVAGTLGAAGGTAASAGAQSRVTRRMLFRDAPELSGAYLNRIIIVTERTGRNVDLSNAAGCGFGEGWPPDTLDAYTGLVVEWRNEDTAQLFGTDPTVRAQKLVERDLYVERRRPPIEIGATALVTRRVNCPGNLVGVRVEQVPGIEIRTGPGVETENETGRSGRPRAPRGPSKPDDLSALTPEK